MSKHRISSVAIVGAGAMGGLYASHFAGTGFAVTMVARGERAHRLAEQGLVVNGEPIPFSVYDADQPAGARPADLVIVAVKHHQLESSLDAVASLVGGDTVILSVLNGLDSEELIASRFGSDKVLLCIALAMDAMRVGNRVTFRQAGRLTFGEADNAEPSGRVLAVQEALGRAGLAWETPVDMRHAMWWKFMVNVGVNQASAVMRAPYGMFQSEGSPRSLMDALIEEVIAVAAAEGVNLDELDLARWYEVLERQPPDGKTSMHQDVEAGRPTEVEIFAGRVVTLGLHHDVPTPYTRRWHGSSRHSPADAHHTCRIVRRMSSGREDSEEDPAGQDVGARETRIDRCPPGQDPRELDGVEFDTRSAPCPHEAASGRSGEASRRMGSLPVVGKCLAQRDVNSGSAQGRRAGLTTAARNAAPATEER